MPAFDSFARYVRRYGLPQAVYVDRHTTYRSPGKRTITDELEGRVRPQSQFERALGELGVQVIPTYSPQAKGRVERLFGTFQDRLVKELRLAGVSTREGANQLLKGYLPYYNRRFRVPARRPLDLHRPCPSVAILRRALTIRQPRALRTDNTIQHDGQTYVLQRRWHGPRPTTIQTEQRLDGRLYLLDADRPLRYRAVTRARPVIHPTPPRGRQRVRIPPPDHPWRRFALSQNTTVLLGRKDDISIGR